MKVLCAESPHVPYLSVLNEKQCMRMPGSRAKMKNLSRK